MRQFTFQPRVTWTGNRGSGTLDYRTYDRDHTIEVSGKPLLQGSSDPAFRGDPALYSPEDLLVAAVAACHMLWYLHLCAVSDVVVMAYTDEAEGQMAEDDDGSGHFTSVTLRPRVIIADASNRERARELHAEAHRKCFIANSVNFPVQHEPEIVTEAEANQPT